MSCDECVWYAAEQQYCFRFGCHASGGCKEFELGERNMKHDFNLKERETANIPPEKLYKILRGIFPKEVADEKYEHLNGLKSPKEAVDYEL